ncbi:MAG: hypothetical protein EAZ30_12470 [Betaproteobacteria bacterium]|nr:MAG: hypothetical protein EAZ30_12470 [Betaproteobacteria bacterium]
MKQLIVNALVSLFTGFFLVVGVGGGGLVVGAIYDKLKDDPPRKFRQNARFTLLPDSAFVESSVVRDVPKFTVRGSIRNTDTIDWDVSFIRLEILSKSTSVGKCQERDSPDFRIVKPGESINFLIACLDIANPVSGETFEYRVRAERWDDQKKA